MGVGVQMRNHLMHDVTQVSEEVTYFQLRNYYGNSFSKDY